MRLIQIYLAIMRLRLARYCLRAGDSSPISASGCTASETDPPPVTTRRVSPSVHNANDIAGSISFVLNADEEFGQEDSTMATPGQLVECVATALNVPQSTVVLYDRVLAESGLRSKGGRGKSAPKVTAEDAANLLIAIAGTSSGGIATAARTVQLYSGLRYRKQSSWKDLISDERPQMISWRRRRQYKRLTS